MRILMVCLGNICRSPLAEGIMQHKIAQKGLAWSVDSAGTGHWHTGELPDRRSISVARKYGVDITYQRARQFRREDFDRFDLIFAMDSSNLRDILRQAPDESGSEKVKLILNEAYPGEDREVPDPYYDDNGFELVFKMLDEACEQFIQKNS